MRWKHKLTTCVLLKLVKVAVEIKTIRRATGRGRPHVSFMSNSVCVCVCVCANGWLEASCLTQQLSIIKQTHTHTHRVVYISSRSQVQLARTVILFYMSCDYNHVVLGYMDLQLWGNQLNLHNVMSSCHFQPITSMYAGFISTWY